MEIRERFVLSGQYNPEALWNEYQESIFFELKRTSSLSCSLVRCADISFKQSDVMTIALPESPIARRREGEISDFLQSIFTGRCNQPVKIDFEYTSQGEDSYRENAEYKINALVEAASEKSRPMRIPNLPGRKSRRRKRAKSIKKVKKSSAVPEGRIPETIPPPAPSKEAIIRIFSSDAILRKIRLRFTIS